MLSPAVQEASQPPTVCLFHSLTIVDGVHVIELKRYPVVFEVKT
jgi:hypothetical protein